MHQKFKLGIVGCGNLAGIVADALANGLLEEYELVGVMSRTLSSAERLAERAHCTPCATLDDLLALHPDYIVEMASPTGLREIAAQALTHGANLVVLSIGAFADHIFYEEIARLAKENGTRVYLASGAIGGFDVLRTVSLMGGIKSSITTEKSPASLRGTPVFKDSLMDAPAHVFSGTAKDAIALFPTKVNVAVAAALATAGAEHTDVNIHSTPGFTGDDHRIEAQGGDVRAVVDIYSKTSDIAGWSAVAVLRNIVSPIVF